METETPRAVPLTAASLAMLESPEYGEDPSTMLLRRVLSSPHEMGDPNAPDDGDRRPGDPKEEPLLAAPLTPPSALLAGLDEETSPRSRGAAAPARLRCVGHKSPRPRRPSQFSIRVQPSTARDLRSPTARGPCAVTMSLTIRCLRATAPRR